MFDAVFTVVFVLAAVLVKEFVFVTKIAFDGKFAFIVLAFASTAELAFVSTAAFVLAFASVAVFDSAGVSATVSNTDKLPVSAGIASSRADNINSVAATIVIFDKIVCAPRG